MDNRDKRWVRKAIDDRLVELGILTANEPVEEDESGLEPESPEPNDKDQEQDSQDSTDQEHDDTTNQDPYTVELAKLNATLDL